ncbi:MAG: hypothetical protein ACRET1_09765, partial [Burkholderiales bacterium]
MNRIILGMLVCISSTAALAQNTYCSTYGNSTSCLTYGSVNNQSSTTNCYGYGNTVSCQQSVFPKVKPAGCGTAVG